MRNTQFVRANESKPNSGCGVTPTVQRIQNDPESSNLVNFTFVFSVLVLWFAGSGAIYAGSLFASFSLMVAGALIMTLGTVLYGWSISAELASGGSSAAR
jgi:hypothetical protein